MGLAIEVDFEETQKHINRLINRYLRMSTSDIEESENHIKTSKNMD
jgi:hypothetical protein